MIFQWICRNSSVWRSFPCGFATGTLCKVASLMSCLFPKHFFWLFPPFSKELCQKSIHFQDTYFTLPIYHCWEKIVVSAKTIWTKHSFKAPKSSTDFKFCCSGLKTRYKYVATLISSDCREKLYSSCLHSKPLEMVTLKLVCTSGFFRQSQPFLLANECAIFEKSPKWLRGKTIKNHLLLGGMLRSRNEECCREMHLQASLLKVSL